MIEVRDVTKAFGNVQAVDGVSFSVAAGEIVGVLGPNGAGKTTTLRMLAGVFPPTTGTVRIAGHEVANPWITSNDQGGWVVGAALFDGCVLTIDQRNSLLRVYIPEPATPGRRQRDETR